MTLTQRLQSKLPAGDTFSRDWGILLNDREYVGISEIISKNQIRSFNFKTKTLDELDRFLPQKEQYKIIVTSGASCPDSEVDKVMQKIMYILGTPLTNSDLDN